MSIHRTAQETSGQENLVSVIMPFLDTEQFIEEAIQSVLNQTHSEWELLLIDDGSRDGSTQIAQDYQQEQPGKIRYFTHPDGETHGASAARNVGIWQARGEYIALLDSDDVWSAEQLSQQVETLRAIPEADMVYGNTLSWYSWTKRPEDEERDAVPDLGISSDTLYAPPEILSLHLRRRASVPCTCSMLIRRSLVEQAGGFEEEFRYIFTDQVFYAKLFTCGTVYVVDENWGKYRRHSRSSVSLVEQRRAIPAAEFRYLEWLEQYLRKTGINDRKLWRALRGAIRPYRHPLMHRLVARKQVFLASLAAALSYGVRWFRSQPRGIITAHSNPILSSSPDGLAATNLSWKFRGAAEVEVRIDAADGPLFARTGGDAEKETGEWVQDGTVFYLQNVSHGIPLTRHHTLATVRVHFLPQIEIRPLPSAKPALDGDWYDEELGAVGMERFLAGNYLKRNQALAKWILDSGVKRVFEFAAGGAGLAKILEERTDYLWSDFAAVPAKAAKNLLSRASIEQIDITKEYENVPWGHFHMSSPRSMTV